MLSMAAREDDDMQSNFRLQPHAHAATQVHDSSARSMPKSMIVHAIIGIVVRQILAKSCHPEATTPVIF